ncbi:MAG TPA: MFS transporter [Candidatus Sulfotelmatobacter sp.]|jgi:MFS family permease
MRSTQPKVFYGWWVALTGTLGSFLGIVTVVVFSFGIFAKAIGQEFHAGRAQVSLAFTILSLTSAFCFPVTGRLVDRYGPRKVLLTATTILGVILMSSIVLVHALWQLYAIFFAMGLVSSGAGTMPYADAVSHWFDRRRGLALSVLMIGMGLGAVVVPMIAQQFVHRWGWHLSYCLFGVAMLLIPVPAIAAFLKDNPESMGLLPDGETDAQARTRTAVEEAGPSVSEAARTSAFWIMLFAFFLLTASVHACFLHLPAILTDRGSAFQMAALASSLLGVGVFIGRASSGYLMDKFFAPRVAAVLFSAVAIGIAFLAMGHTIQSAFVGAFLVGLGTGAEVDIIAYLISRYFGLRSYGSISGWIWAIYGISGGLGAYLMGLGYDKTGSYAAPLGGFFLAAALATVLIMSLGPYRYSVKLAHATGGD